MNCRSIIGKAFLLLLLLLLLAVVFAVYDPEAEPAVTETSGGNTTRTAGANELKRWQSIVFMGPSGSSSLPVFNESGWHPLADGDAVSTNGDGEAELNLDGCYPGHLYVFQHSTYEFGVFGCSQGDETSSSCLSGGIYAASCDAAYSVDTGSARVTVSGTSFGVAYLPEARELTLVVVMADTVQVEPWISAERGWGQAIRVPEARFLFTLPGSSPPAIAGLTPRVAHPVSELPRLLATVDPQYELWVLEMAERAEEEEQLPPEWPRELGGEGPGPSTPTRTTRADSVDGAALEVVMAGDPLREPGVQQAIVSGVDWQTTLGQAGLGDIRAVTVIENESVDLLSQQYDPELAQQLLDELGYVPRGDDVGFMPRFAVQVLFPEGEAGNQLAVAADILYGYLFELNIQNELRTVSAAELNRLVTARENLQEAVIVFRPRR